MRRVVGSMAFAAAALLPTAGPVSADPADTFVLRFTGRAGSALLTDCPATPVDGVQCRAVSVFAVEERVNIDGEHIGGPRVNVTLYDVTTLAEAPYFEAVAVGAGFTDSADARIAPISSKARWRRPRLGSASSSVRAGRVGVLDDRRRVGGRRPDVDVQVPRPVDGTRSARSTHTRTGCSGRPRRSACSTASRSPRRCCRSSGDAADRPLRHRRALRLTWRRPGRRSRRPRPRQPVVGHLEEALR